ncbi:molybdenum cofactor guanylyltransferase [Devosia sp. A369]
MSLPHAVIIAGGQGARLGGVRKADLRIGGKRLLERVTAALGGVATPLMISTGPDSGRAVASGDSLAVDDLPGPVGGPLAGLAAAVDNLQRRGIHAGLLISVTVDTPFLPGDFVAAMEAGLGDAPAAYAAWGAEFYPPNAIWQLAALAGLPQQVLRGEGPKSLKALHEALGPRRVDWAPHYTDNPFANLNTLADLLSLERLARDKPL